MTTPDAPQNSAEILVHKTGELTDKTTTLVTSVAETIGRRIRALDALRTNESITADPARMATIVDSLFAAADTLIYLAEDMRGVTQRTERSVIESKAQIETPASATTDEQEVYAPDLAPEKAELAPKAPVPVAPVARTQEQKKDTALEELVDHTINTLLRMDEKRPYISIQDIISVGINGRHLSPEDFERLKIAVGSDHRLEHVGGPEYRIKGRDVNARWIDTGALRQAADQFISNMVRWGSGEENLENLFKAIGRTQMRPTEPERSELIRLLKNDYRVVRVAEGSIIVDASRTEEDDPNKHLRGMSPAQLDKALGQLHMKGQSGFRRKR